MDCLRRLRQIACSLDVDCFVTAHAGFYLLGLYPEQGEDGSDGLNLTSHGRPWTFFPPVPGPRLPERGEEAQEQDELHRLGLFLLRIEKSHRNPWKGRISVGRATNNDLAVRHSSVSKLHAHFVLERDAVGMGAASPSLQVADVGSKNGTRKNGTRLPTGELRIVDSGDVLHFGEVRCEVLDAAALYEQVRRRFPTKRLGNEGGAR